MIFRSEFLVIIRKTAVLCFKVGTKGIFRLFADLGDKKIMFFNVLNLMSLLALLSWLSSIQYKPDLVGSRFPGKILFYSYLEFSDFFVT